MGPIFCIKRRLCYGTESPKNITVQNQQSNYHSSQSFFTVVIRHVVWPIFKLLQLQSSCVIDRSFVDRIHAYGVSYHSVRLGEHRLFCRSPSIVFVILYNKSARNTDVFLFVASDYNCVVEIHHAPYCHGFGRAHVFPSRTPLNFVTQFCAILTRPYPGGCSAFMLSRVAIDPCTDSSPSDSGFQLGSGIV